MDSLNEIIRKEQPALKISRNFSDEQWPKTTCTHGTSIEERDGEVCYWQCSSCVKDAKEKREAEEKRDRDRRRYDMLINDGGLFNGPIKFSPIPKRFAGKTIESYEAKTKKQQEIKSLVLKYVAGFDKVMENGTGMILAGSPGTGKTHLAWGIVSELRKRTIPAALVRASSMTGSVKATYSANSEYTPEQVVTAYSLMDLLIIDEVGVQVQTDSEVRIFFDIINRRYEDMKPTIIITNLTFQETAQYIGERVIDRMKEGGGVVFAMDWDSFRK